MLKYHFGTNYGPKGTILIQISFYGPFRFTSSHLGTILFIKIPFNQPLWLKKNYHIGAIKHFKNHSMVPFYFGSAPPLPPTDSKHEAGGPHFQLHQVLIDRIAYRTSKHTFLLVTLIVRLDIVNCHYLLYQTHNVFYLCLSTIT